MAEVRHNREEFAARFNHDVEAMVNYLRKEQERSGQKVDSFSAEATKGLEKKLGS